MEKIIKVHIKINTDNDFEVGFPNFIVSNYKIKCNDNCYYSIKLDLVENQTEKLISFLKELQFSSHISKQYLIDKIKYNIDIYVKHIRENGLSSPKENFISGNQEFNLNLYETTSKWI